MKKLMIAAAIVCAAALSHAASVSWASGSITQANPTTGEFSGTAMASGSGSLYRIDSTFYTTWLETLTAATTLEAQQTAMTSLKTALEGKSVVGTADLYKGAITITDPTDISTASPSNPIDIYGAVIYSYTDTNGKDWFIADVGYYQAEANSKKSIADVGTKFGGSSGTTAIQGWATAAVPEPTSGLLLLLGVAGLALRRRRA